MKALVLSGGGAKGAFQNGAINHLFGDLRIQYDILCGISSGAVNSGFLAQFAHGQEQEAAHKMHQLWSSLNTNSIYKRWQPFGRWHALWKSSFFDSSPLLFLIKKEINLERIRAAGKNVSIGALSISSGKYAVFTQNDDDFVDAVAASASFPGMLCPVKIRDQLWCDGGIQEHTPIKMAIDLGATDVDVIMTSPETRNKHFIERPTALDIIKRSIDLSTDKIMSNDIDKAIMYNKLAECGLCDKKAIKINIIRPQFNLIDNLLDFNPAKIQKMIEIGYETAVNKYSKSI
jgi:NTE family protein